VTPDAVVLVFSGIVGLCVGSFLNVCIYRLPREESVQGPASHCPSCWAPLKWYDNIPVFSYLVLRGRCRRCGLRISPMYPLVELITAVMFVTAYAVFGPGWVLAARLIFGCAMIVLFVIDLQHHILPNAITLPGIVVGLAFSLIAPPGCHDALIGAMLGAGILFAIAEGYYRLRGIEGMGMGDVKMLAMVGAFLGWELMLVTLLLSTLLGTIVGVGIITARRGDMKYALPFGTFLAVAAVTAGFVGDSFVHWYVSLS
jgi:leader peptidase (prepilin peptidase) / N-methyltransferase